MKNILVVESSPMGEKSVSRKLTQELVAALVERHPGSRVVVRDLADSPLPHLSAETLAAFGTAAEKRDDAQTAAARASERAVDELLAADIVVIGAPMWNFGPPSGLKAWVDHVARAGRTFSYTAEGPRGLASGRQAYVVAATGGVYSSGPAQGMDFLTPWLKAVLGFFGMTDVSFIRAEGLAIPQLKDAAVQKASRDIVELIAASVAA